MSGAGLADLSDANYFNHRGFFLPIRRFNGLIVIRVDASKPLPVIVKYRHLPVMVFSSLVFSKCCVFPSFHLEILAR